MITLRSRIPVLSFFLLVLSIMEWVQGWKYQIISVDLSISSCISICSPSNVLMLCCKYINIQNAMTFWWTDILIALLTPFAEKLCVFIRSHSSFFCGCCLSDLSFPSLLHLIFFISESQVVSCRQHLVGSVFKHSMTISAFDWIV